MVTIVVVVVDVRCWLWCHRDGGCGDCGCGNGYKVVNDDGSGGGDDDGGDGYHSSCAW